MVAVISSSMIVKGVSGGCYAWLGAGAEDAGAMEARGEGKCAVLLDKQRLRGFLGGQGSQLCCCWGEERARECASLSSRPRSVTSVPADAAGDDAWSRKE